MTGRPRRIAVLGATASVGQAVVTALAGAPPEGGILAQGRDPRWLDALARPGVTLVPDGLDDADRLRPALSTVTHIILCAPIRFARIAQAAAPRDLARFVAIGTTRVHSRHAGEEEVEIAAARDRVLAAPLPSVVLEPTLIYGGPREQNVHRLARLIRRLPVLPLPAGGRALVQPIFVEDLARALIAALDAPGLVGRALIVAGPEPVRYAEMARLTARTIGRPLLIVPVPAGLLFAAARVLRHVPGGRVVEAIEIRRLLEDRAFDIAEMRRVLGIEPLPLAEGLARSFAARPV